MFKRPDIKNEEVISLYKSGLSAEKIASKFSCSQNTILKRLQNAGKKRRKRSGFGEKSPRWKGGRRKTSLGYISVYCPGHSRASRNHVFEHILVWEKTYGKMLSKDMVIHHLNGIRDDNRAENLMAMKRNHHTNINEPFKKRIRDLEKEIKELRQADLFKSP